MRIAMLSWESLHSNAVGGVAAHVTELAAALERQGHEAHVFTRRPTGQRGHDRIDGVHYHRCSYPGHPDFVDEINNMCRAMVDRLFDIEDFVGRFDVVHAHDWLTANALIWTKQGRGHPCVLTIHSTEYGRCGNFFHNGRSVRIRHQERAGTYWADRLIAVSQATKKEIQWMYEVPEDKITVVYNGVSPHRFDVDIDPGVVKHGHKIGPVDPTVLFCGRLAYQKGPDLLLEAVPAVLRTYPRAKFVFVGDGEMRGSLEGRARHLGIGDAVRFLGHRGGNELVALFKMADVACIPSRNEPFGIVVLEAWSARKPVVVTQNGGPNEYVHHEVNGLKIHALPDSVAWGIGTLFGNFDRARWMGDNGRRTVEERFTWDMVAEKTLQVYDPAAVRTPVVTVATVPNPARKPAAENGLRVSVRLTLKPKRLGKPIAEAKASCEQVLADAGFPARFAGNVLVVEGPWDAVLGPVHRCCALLPTNGGTRLSISAKPVGPPPPARPSETARKETAVEPGPVADDPRRADVLPSPPLPAKRSSLEPGTVAADWAAASAPSGDVHHGDR